MVRVAPIADVSPWLVSVAEVLPQGHRDPAPYALGEAVSELAAYASALTDRSWQAGSATTKTRASLAREIAEQTEFLGPVLRALLDPTLGALEAAEGRPDVVRSAARLEDAWREGLPSMPRSTTCVRQHSPPARQREHCGAWQQYCDRRSDRQLMAPCRFSVQRRVTSSSRGKNWRASNAGPCLSHSRTSVVLS